MKSACRLAQIFGALLLPIAASVAPVEAACDSTQIQIVAPASIVDRAIPITWRVDPACNPIETGVSVSGAEGRFISAGTPMYGGRELYSDQIPVSEAGIYWLGAYTVDEQGDITHSPSRAVLVLVLVPAAPTANPDASARTRASVATSAPLCQDE
jgi:hypothetical protein